MVKPLRGAGPARATAAADDAAGGVQPADASKPVNAATATTRRLGRIADIRGYYSPAACSPSAAGAFVP